MPQKYVLASNTSSINKHFNLESSHQDFKNNLIITPGNQSLIITQENPHKLTVSTFGLTPSWSKQPMQIINARAEGDKNPENNPNYSGSKAIFLKKSFRNPLFNKRCIVIADAFISYCSDQPFLVYLKGKKRPFGMAGIYDIWTDPATGEKLHSYAIITVPANNLLQKIPVSRMPVILPYGAETSWLKASNHLHDILAKIIQYPSKAMNAHQISKEVDTTATTEMLRPIGEKLASEVRKISFPSSHYVSKKKPTEPGKLWFDNSPKS
ncbi:MAG: SOS response-associated peptidase [Bacteroidales bacterium]|nr:SOS response-associated peptidase [Bacteroidales bacterium]